MKVEEESVDQQSGVSTKEKASTNVSRASDVAQTYSTCSTYSLTVHTLVLDVVRYRQALDGVRGSCASIP